MGRGCCVGNGVFWQGQAGGALWAGARPRVVARFAGGWALRAPTLGGDCFARLQAGASRGVQVRSL
jgi:hypothetical protein